MRIKMKHRTMLRASASLLVIVMMLSMLTGCSTTYLYESEDGSEYYAGTSSQLDTYVSLSLFVGGSDDLMDASFKLCREYDDKFSRTSSGGELYNLNRASRKSDGPLAGYEISDELAALISKALHYSELTDGSYDVTICPVSKLWNFSSDKPSVPEKAELDDALKLVGWKGVTVSGNTVTFDKEGMELDLGSIAKGYIADRIKEYLVKNNVTSGVISLGGNILCIGARPDGHPFNVGIQKPFAESAETIAVMQITDLSVVSTGIYERCFTEFGNFYHHVLNPADGFPFDNGLVGVSVIGESSADCDALSTACFSLGLEKGMDLIDSIPGYHAVFVTDDYDVHFSENFTDYITVTDYVPEEE